MAEGLALNKIWHDKLLAKMSMSANECVEEVLTQGIVKGSIFGKWDGST